MIADVTIKKSRSGTSRFCDRFLGRVVSTSSSMYSLPSQSIRFVVCALLLCGLAPELRAKGTSHKVRSGESLGAIAPRYGCTVAELMRANPKVQSPDRIRIGQRLKVPRCVAGGPPANCSWRADHIDSKELGEKMRRLGFTPPQKFRALVVKTTLSVDGARIEGHELWDYRKKGARPGGWNPASTIKIFSGVGALQRIRALGFSPKAKVTFHDAGGDHTFALDALYEDAVHWSKNVPHNRLVQLAGFDYLNGPDGPLQRAGLEHSYLMRAYARAKWTGQGQSSSLRPSPEITLTEGKKTRRLPAQKGTGKYPCYGAACTSLSDLTRMMCTLMLHEQLPPASRLGFGRKQAPNEQGPHLQFIRQRLNRKRKGKKDPIWDIFERRFIPKKAQGAASQGRPQLFRKNGFARQWASENIYVYLPGRRERWMVALAGYPGRYSLTKAADIIATLIAENSL
jgi:murein DD-endopeptidase MepM/ murein hydrolase activator NlpD